MGQSVGQMTVHTRNCRELQDGWMDGWMDENKEWTVCTGCYGSKWIRHVETTTETNSEMEMKIQHL